MRDSNTPIPVSYLRECVSYDPETGLFTWLPRPARHFVDPRVLKRWNLYRAGTPAFRVEKGRRYCRATVTYKGREVELTAHRAAWALQTGAYPEEQVDHRNGHTHDNRWANLRAATNSENQRNKRQNSNAKAPYKGVAFCTGRWKSQIWVGGKSLYLGRFDTAEEAHSAYASAAKKYFGEFARVA